MKQLQVIPSSSLLLNIVGLLDRRALNLSLIHVLWFRKLIDQLIVKFLKLWSVFSLLYRDIKTFLESLF